MRTDKRQFANGDGSRAARIALLLALLGILPITVSAAHAQTVAMKDVEAAVLKEDWKQVVELLRDVSDDIKKSPNPVLRLIKGHASLALNQNNDSVRLFLSVVVREDIDACDRWAEGLAQGNPASSISHYFQGDVKARQKNWSAAITCFTRALDRSGKNPLMLNARGVAYARNHRLHEARLDFAEAAANRTRQLTDVYANIGALAIQKKDGAEGAIRAYTEAIRINPNFALALHGRACVELALKRIGPAAQDLLAAHKSAGSFSSLFAENYSAVVSRNPSGAQPDVAPLMARSESDVRGSLKTTVFDNAKTAWNGYVSDPQPVNLRNFMSFFNNLGPDDKTRILNESITPSLQQNPQVLFTVQTQIRNGIDRSSLSGPAANVNANFPSGIGINLGPVGVSVSNLASQHASDMVKEINQNLSFIQPTVNNLADQRLQQLAGVVATLTTLRSSGALSVPQSVSMNTPGSLPTASGCLATFAGSIHDAGDWSFRAYYGLCYQD